MVIHTHEIILVIIDSFLLINVFHHFSDYYNSVLKMIIVLCIIDEQKKLQFLWYLYAKRNRFTFID